MSKHLERDLEALERRDSRPVVAGRGDDRQGLPGAGGPAGRSVERGGRQRTADRHARGEDRGRVPQDSRAASAGGGRPAAHGDGAQDQHRAGADRRPGGEHRRADELADRSPRTSRFRTSSSGWRSRRPTWCTTRSTRSSSSTSTAPATFAAATTKSTRSIGR